MANTCVTCRFWQETTDDQCLVNDESPDVHHGGECRRRAPSLVLASCPATLAKFTAGWDGEREDDGEQDLRRVFPLTYSWDWCGEHAS